MRIDLRYIRRLEADGHLRRAFQVRRKAPAYLMRPNAFKIEEGTRPGEISRRFHEGLKMRRDCGFDLVVEGTRTDYKLPSHRAT